MFKKVTDKIYSLTTNMKPVTKKKLVSSYISLFLSFVVLITSTISWFTIVQTVSVKSNVFTMYSSSGLRVNEGEDISNHIYLDDFVLYESSSVDGRNMFFPTKGTFSSNTSEMIFREGTAGDCNQTYIHRNFTLKGDSTLTEIYLKSYNITVDDQIFNGGTEITYDSSGKPSAQVKKQECPVRIAFITDSADAPIVIDPTALVDGHVKNYNAVKSVNNGVPSTQKTKANSFSNHYFSYENPLFKLFGTEPLEVTMVVWLEGTGGNCDKYAGEKISIDIELESNFSDTDIIYFVDDTRPDNDGATESSAYKWINQNGDCIVTMAYKVSNDKTDDPNDTVTKTVVMKQISATEWIAPIPKTVETNISFYRYSLTDEVIYNAWYTESGINSRLSGKASGWLGQMGRQLQESRKVQGTDKLCVKYTAVRGNGYSVTNNESERLSPCIGFWDYTESSSGGGNSGGGGNVTPDDPVTIERVQIGIAVNFSNKSWITNDLSNHGYNMYAIYDVAGTEKALLIDTDTSSYQRCECKNKIIEKNSTLVRFELRSSSHTKVLNFNGNVTFDQDYNHTFNVNDNDTVG